jgi:hypothetical protein
VAEPEWALLTYRLPREPSTPRITLWRKLRRLGALQLVDGLVALPADPKTTEAFEWLAEEVVEAGGEAWTWRARPGSKAQEGALRGQLAAALADEYRSLLEEAEAARSEPTRRTAQRLRRELHRIEARDHVSPKERDQARAAVERLLASVDLAPADAAEPEATSR